MAEFTGGATGGESQQGQQQAASVSGEASDSVQAGQQSDSQQTEGAAAGNGGDDDEFTFELSDDDSSSGDGDGADNAGDDGGQKKLTSQERIQQLIEQNKELKAQIENGSNGQQQQQQDSHVQKNTNVADVARKLAEKYPHFDVDVTAFNTHIETLKERASDLDLEGKNLEAHKVRREIDSLFDQFDTNERNRAQFAREIQQHQQRVQQEQGFVKQFDAVAEQYREFNKIPKDVWDRGSQYVSEQLAANPLLVQEFQHVTRTQGMAAAVRWAHDLADKGLGSQAEDAINRREQAKGQQFGGAGGGGKTLTVKSYQDLINAGSKAVIQFKRQNPSEYSRLYERHLNRNR